MKSFISFFVEKSQFTLILIFGILVLGISTLINIPKGEDPELSYPYYTVIAILPGALPAEIQDQVVKPLEDRLYELENVKEIKSIASGSAAFITVEYDYSVNTENKYQEVIREVEQVRNQKLPKSVQSVSVKQVKNSDVVIAQIAISSDNATYAELEKYATELSDNIKKIDGTQNTSIWGFPEREIKVEVDIHKLAKYNLSVPRILSSLDRDSYSLPAGDVISGNSTFSVKAGNIYNSIEDIGNTIIYSINGQNLKLKDVATIRESYEEEKHLIRLNQTKSVLVTTSLKDGYTINTIAADIRKATDNLSQHIPSHIQIKQNFDQSESVQKRMTQLGTDFIIAILLVIITLLPLGLRSTLVVMITVPLSLAIGIICLNFLGYSLNQLSIVGLILALGILVDDAIVVNENIERALRSGLPLKKAIIESTGQIATAVIGVTITLIIAFIPIIAMPGGPGEFVRPLPMAVILSVGASLLVSLTLVPFISSKILKDKVHPEGNIFLKNLQQGIHASYGKIMDKALRHPKRAASIMGVITICGLMIFSVMGFSLFPKSDKPQFYIEIETPPNSSLDYTNLKTKEVEEILKQESKIKYYTANVGRGNPKVYYNVMQHENMLNYGNIFVQCDDDIGIENKSLLIDSLRLKLSNISDAKIHVVEYEQGVLLEAPIVIRLFGKDIDTLRHYSTKIEDIVRSVEGTTYVQNPILITKTGLKIDINKEKAAMYGINSRDIDNAVRMAISGIPAGELQLADIDHKTSIRVLLPKNRFQTIDIFDKIYVPSISGENIPLKNVANITLEKTPSSLTKLNKELYTTITSSAQNGYLYNDLNNKVEEKLSTLKLPEGYYWKAAGEKEGQERAFAGFGTILIISLFAFIGALILEFKSFKSTLIILSVIPLGMIGGVLALLIAGETLSFISLVGFIALIGIEIKNSILLVDYTNHLRKEENMPLLQAVAKAGEVRFIPILLTTMTAIAGMIPLIIQHSPLYSPLAIVIVGGLISSLLLSRILTPVLYLLLPPAID